VQFHEKSIHDVLELTISEAIQFFAGVGEQGIDEHPHLNPRVGSRLGERREADAKRQLRVDPAVEFPMALRYSTTLALVICGWVSH
jgi:hypothetical protein